MVKWFKRMRWCYNHHLFFLAKILRKIIRVCYSCDIFPTCEIESDVNFVHGGLGCVIHERAKIEGGVEVYQNVTIGGNGKENQKYPGVPIIKKNARVYAGACILGPIIIGENSIVGANAVVLCDVPPNCIAVGVPARIMHKSQDVL